MCLAAAFTLMSGVSALPVSATDDPNATFTHLDDGFTQDLWVGGADTYPVGVAFDAAGDVFTCYGGGHEYSATSTTLVHGSTVHNYVALPDNGCSGLGMANNPDGYMYNNGADGVRRLDPANGLALVGSAAGTPGNTLGIATDPQTGNLVYMANDNSVAWINTALTNGGTFSTATQGASLLDQIAFDPTGNYLFVSDWSGGGLMIIDRTGALVQEVALDHQPDGIAFNTGGNFVAINDTDGTLAKLTFPGGDFTQTPTKSTFASGAGYGDHTGVGPDGCWYVSNSATTYADGTPAGYGLVRICGGGFAPPPGVTPPSNAAPVWQSLAAQSVDYSDALTAHVTATDSDGDLLTLSASGLPTGLSFTDNGGGHGTVSGNATAVPNVYQVTFTANDGHNTPVDMKVNFTVTQEECTVTVPATQVSSAAANTTLSANLAESEGAIAAKTVGFTATDSSSNVFGPWSGVTGSTGGATASAALGAGVYDVNAVFAGDTNYAGCASATPTVLTVSAATAKATGGGWISNTTGRTSFGFNAVPAVTGPTGQLEVRTSKGVFHGSVVTTLTGTKPNAQWTGTGKWNGVAGYRFSAAAYDSGSGKGTDTLNVSILPPGTGTTPVWSTNGPQPLKGGNLVVH